MGFHSDFRLLLTLNLRPPFMKHKKTILFGVLGLVSLAAYVFLFHAHLMTESVEVVESLPGAIQYTNEPAASPDVELLKGIIKAVVNLLPAS